MAGIKSNNAIFEKRVSIVMDMLLAELRRCEIIENIRNNDELKWETKCLSAKYSFLQRLPVLGANKKPNSTLT